jgi:hypothetical protein
MGFEVLTAAEIKIVAFWVMTLFSFIEETKKLDEIGDFSSLDPYKMEVVLEEEEKEKCHR